VKKILNIVILSGIILIFSGCGNKISDEFRLSYSDYLKTGDKMNIMIESGVNYFDYLDQMYEVQASYTTLLNYKWPNNAIEAKNNFDSSIESLKLINEVWKYKNEDTLSFTLISCNVGPKIEFEIADLLELETAEYISDNSCSDVIGVLMGFYSESFNNGKDKMKNLIN